MSDKLASPLEDLFDIDPRSTQIFNDNIISDSNERSSKLIDPISGEIISRKIEASTTDLETEERLEDLHIDGQLENLHMNAITAFEKTIRMAEEVDPKFAARNSEVAAQYLNIALNAINSRVDAKFKRLKIRISKNVSTVPNIFNNNGVIIANRNEMLQALLQSEEYKVLDEKSN